MAKKSLVFFIFLISFVLISLGQEILNDKILIQLAPNADLGSLDSLLNVHQLYKEPEILCGQFLVAIRKNVSVRGFAKTNELVQLNSLASVLEDNTTLVKSVSLNTVYPITYFSNDPYYSKQWNLKNTGLNGGLANCDIKFEQALAKLNNLLLPPTIVAMMDDGINVDNPEFVDALWINTQEIPNDKIDNDENGYTDDLNGVFLPAKEYADGYDLVSNGTEHGNGVAGIMCAQTNNKIAISGVSNSIKLMTLKMEGAVTNPANPNLPLGLDPTVVSIVEGIHYAGKYGAKVLNWSGGYFERLHKDNHLFPSFYEDMEKIAFAIQSAPFLCVFASGNYLSFMGITSPDLSVEKVYPQALLYNSSNVIIVGSIDHKGQVNEMYNKDIVDVLAPGTSETNFYPSVSKKGTDNYIQEFGGTSGAAPHVTAVAAVAFSLLPTARPEEIKEIICNTSNLSFGREKVKYGLLNFEAVVQKCLDIIADGTTLPGGGVGTSTEEQKTVIFSNINSTTNSSINNSYLHAFLYKHFDSDFQSGKSFPFNFDRSIRGREYILFAPFVISTKKEFFEVNSKKYKMNNWSNDLTFLRMSIQPDVDFSNSVTEYKAYFKQIIPISVYSQIDGVDFPNELFLKDPWFIDENNLQLGDWRKVTYETSEGKLMNRGLFKSMLYNPNIKSKPYYVIKLGQSSLVYSGINAEFSNWSTNGIFVINKFSNETPFEIQNENSVLVANYKGHLRTGAPAQSNAINQTRLIKNPLNDSKLLVYESMGEVWLTGYSPGSNTWFPEFRLSSGNGTAKNPSFSNVLYLGSYPNTTTYLTIAFVDNGKVMVQPVQLQADWGSFSVDYLHWNSSNNVRELLDLTSKTTVSVVGDSRPVVQLISSGSYGLKIWWANETTNQGLASGYLDLTTTLASGITAGIAKSLSGGMYYTEVSSNSTDQYPVLITYPAAFGQAAKQLIYYLGAGYAAGKRIVEYNVSGGTKTVLSAPSGDYSYSTLSGAANYQSASYVLTATAVVPGQSTTTYNTNIYTKPTYYSGVSLSKVYTGKVNSSVSVQNMVYNGAPTYEVNLVTNSVWEKGTGGATLTQVTTGAQGVFVPATVEINQRPAMLTKSDASGPSKLQFYNGATVLNKGESVLYADVRSVRNYATLSGQSKTAILDFAGALVEPVDSLENGSSICAVKLISPDQNTIIVRQPDSIKTALAIDLIRNGVSVRSYSASLWDELSINSFEDVQDGDVLVFRLGFPVASSWGYEIYDFNGTSLTKNGEETADAVKLKKLENGVSVYPNPFNPNTSISVSLEAPASVKVMVFTILGQMVSDFGKADLGAGVHTYAFDGKTLASGTYFYRVEIGEKVKTGKFQLLK